MSSPTRPENTSARSTHAGQGRVVATSYSDGVDDETKIEAIFAIRALWDLAAMVPPQATGGPRKLPTIIYCAMLGLQAVYGSFRKAEANLRRVTTGEGTVIWNLLCDLAAKYHSIYRPDEPPLDAEELKAKRPLTAQNFFDARRQWLGPYLPALEAAFEAAADEAALEIGYADPDGEGSINNLVRERTGTTDGKVVKSVGTRYRLLTADELKDLRKTQTKITPAEFVTDTYTGEVIAASDMVGEELYNTGGGLKIGYKFVSLSIRDDHHNSSLVLRFRRQMTTQEAQEFTDAALDAKAKLRGLLAVVADTALKGDHHRQLMRHGIVGISPVAAESVADDDTRTEKTGLLETRYHDHPHGYRCEHKIYYHGGQVGEYDVDDSGTSSFVAFPDAKAELRADKANTRMYAVYPLTCRQGLLDDDDTIVYGTLRLNLTQEAPEGKGGINFAENVRLVAPEGERYRRTYGWREDSENNNRQLDNVKWGSRARSWGAERQHWNEIGGAIVQDGVALLLHRHRVASGTVNTVKRHRRKGRYPGEVDATAQLATPAVAAAA